MTGASGSTLSRQVGSGMDGLFMKRPYLEGEGSEPFKLCSVPFKSVSLDDVGLQLPEGDLEDLRVARERATSVRAKPQVALRA